MKKVFRGNLLLKFLIVLIAIGLAVYWFVNFSKDTGKPVINDFESCVEAGNIVAESYPRQCRTAEGRLFVEVISPTPAKQEKIRIFSPRPNEAISSPLKVSGEARGMWFFEASFPIFIEDDEGRVLGRGIASAQGDWMTEDFVPFEAEIVFETGGVKSGVLILERDNPSGLAENADEVRMPVLFGSANKRNVKLFYYNRTADPDVSCSADAVQSVEREINLTKSPIKDTLAFLIKGEITSAEKEAGFTSEFPIEGLILKGVNLKEGVLIVEFADPGNKTGGGSCRAGLLRAQIEKTAKQFGEVRDVRILPEEAFQP